MAERLRLYSGITELEYATASVKFSTTTPIAQSTISFYKNTDIKYGSTIDFRKNDGVTNVFSPKVLKRTKELFWGAVLISGGWQLNNEKIEKVYTSTSPEDIVKDIIDNYTDDLTYVSTQTSGITLDEYIGKGYLIDVINDMIYLLKWQFRIDASYDTYFEESGFINNGAVLTNGANCQIKRWADDGTKLVNSVKIVGGFENHDTTEIKSGTSTTFSLDHKPNGGMRITVSGVEQSPNNYTVKAESKSVVFDSNVTDPTIYYTYNRPVVVEYQDDTSIIDNNRKIYKELQAPWLNSLSDARQYAKKYVRAYGYPLKSARAVIPGIVYDYALNEQIQVIDSQRGENEVLVLQEIEYVAENASTVLYLGNVEYQYTDWRIDIESRIKQLNRRYENEDNITYSRVLTHTSKISCEVSTTNRYFNPKNTMLTDHITLGMPREDFTVEPDCSLNARHGTWNGTGVSTGAQFSTSGKRLSCGVFNGTDNYLTISESLAYTHGTYSVSFWVYTDDVAQSDVRFFAESDPTDNNLLFTIGTGYANNKIRLYIRNSAGTELLSSDSTTTLSNNTWHHIVWTDDGGTAKLYVDAVEDATDFSYTPTGQTYTTSTLGAILRASASNLFDGNIDEFRTYDIILSQTQITNLNNKIQVLDNLQCYWSMDNPLPGDKYEEII